MARGEWSGFLFDGVRGWSREREGGTRVRTTRETTHFGGGGRRWERRGMEMDVR